MVMGSEGRQEQTLVTDQDNAIIYEDKANEQRELVRDYFLDFADRISTRLNDIGFSFCEGGFMAKNPKWTHSLSHWKGNYDEWTNVAAPDTVIKFSTFFDCRFIYGEKKLFNELKQHMIDGIGKSSSKFLFNVASNALHYEPPLTFFNGIRTFSQDEKKVFNIKKSMTPIVDLIRMLALKNMIIETNTGQRMQKLYDGGFLNEAQFKELHHAYYYLMGVRLKNQSHSMLLDFEDPSNLIEPKKLTQVEQATLREIFKFIKDFQSMIRFEFKL
jgi:CBS domain-containing protein